ncbi:uncharacterized protein QYS62_004350 [Fusarium acuminatum]|uniref:Uncharacterized protein n=1 Tax=Fusarium acuminatum TaxID=5515 RepID=A0ABZ2WRZ9_9HYPO
MALRTLSQKILATSLVAIVTTAGVYGFTVRKRVSIVDRNLITRSTTIPSTFEKSKSVSEIVNFKKHVHHSDWRFITLDIPAQHDVPDEVLLAKFVKGFFGGAVLRPERLTLQMLGIKLVHFSRAEKTTVLWSLKDIPETKLLPDNSVLFGAFQVLDSRIAEVGDIKHLPKQTESYVDFAFGSDEVGFGGVHRFSVVRSQKEQSEEQTVQIHFQHMTCNPTVNKPLRMQWMLGFHEMYADYLFRDGVGEIKRWMSQAVGN